MRYARVCAAFVRICVSNVGGDSIKKFKAKGQAMQKEIVTVTQLAKRLQLKPETIRIWARKGIIPSLHPTSKTLRFDVESVLTAMGKISAGQKGAYER